MTEFNLSEKIHKAPDNILNWNFIKVEDVKEFIRLLKEKFCICDYRPPKCNMCKWIEKFAGDKLC